MKPKYAYKMKKDKRGRQVRDKDENGNDIRVKMSDEQIAEERAIGFFHSYMLSGKMPSSNPMKSVEASEMIWDRYRKEIEKLNKMMKEKVDGTDKG